MRLGVLDVGSNSVHLLVVDALPGSAPNPVSSHKAELRLAELLGPDGRLGPTGQALLVRAVGRAVAAAAAEQVDDLVAFATSAVRDAPDSDEILATVRTETGVDLVVLPGEDEAALTFLAARRWFGWSTGSLLCLDIGGGSLELAAGLREAPDVAVSLPLGAGRLTRDWLPGDPPDPSDVRRLQKHVRAELQRVSPPFLAAGRPDLCVATSKTFRSLARLTGAAPYADGLRVRRQVTKAALRDVVLDLTPMTTVERAGLPGVSATRAPQLLAGALVALEAMTALALDRAVICPWALREGVVLRRLDWLSEDARLACCCGSSTKGGAMCKECGCETDKDKGTDKDTSGK